MVESSEGALGFSLEWVEEGLVQFQVPEGSQRLPRGFKGPGTVSGPVFYNPGMELNRDFAVAFLHTYHGYINKPLTVCDPMAGCGVRGIRFAREASGVNHVVMADINPKAVALTKLNVQHAGLQKSVDVTCEEANALLMSYAKPGKRLDYVDVDPFGSPAVFIESAVRSLRNGGILAFTATDVAVLCGVHARACIRRYATKPLRSEYAHEVAARILLGFAALTAARSDLAIHPLLIHSTDHYIRVYIQVVKSVGHSDRCIDSMGYIHHCRTCLNRITRHGFLQCSREKCERCGSSMDFAGPLWLGPLWNEEFCRRIAESIQKMKLGQKQRLTQILNRILGEARGPPTFYDLSVICDMLNLPVPPMVKMLAAIKKRGCDATLTHFNPLGIRTTASIFDVVQSIR
ncbi:MAG: tRNA (guanine(10)-N(2))-dimethyltransferase [Candidatus Bathyarchaeia archaeon]